MKISI